LKVIGLADEELAGSLKLKGMTAFSTESSWCEKAMTPVLLSILPSIALISSVKTVADPDAIFVAWLLY